MYEGAECRWSVPSRRAESSQNVEFKIASARWKIVLLTNLISKLCRGMALAGSRGVLPGSGSGAATPKAAWWCMGTETSIKSVMTCCQC